MVVLQDNICATCKHFPAGDVEHGFSHCLHPFNMESSDAEMMISQRQRRPARLDVAMVTTAESTCEHWTARQ